MATRWHEDQKNVDSISASPIKDDSAYSLGGIDEMSSRADMRLAWLPYS